MRLAATLAVALLAAACRPAPAPDAVEPAPAIRLDVVELDIAEASRRMAEGELDSRTLTQAYLDRIAAIDGDGPRLNSMIELAPDALEAAAALDAERADGKVRGPLHGIPVVLKDNIDAAGMVNSAGSLALAGHRPARDAFMVQRLREAGAVILGKTNLSEWANFRSTRSSSGWSSRGGQTRNAYVLDRNPCGSSSGTGTAISASLAMVGVGTETDGSILCPSAVAGLVGLKPTVGLVSRDGIIPISISQDTAGPMGRSVADVAVMLGAMAAVDASDPAGAAAADHVVGDYSAFLDADALRGKRIGVLRQAMGFHPAVDANVEQAIAALQAAGAEVVDVQIESYRRWSADELTVLLYEFKDGLDRYLASVDGGPDSLEALIAWNDREAARTMPHFGQELLVQAQAKGPLTDAAYLEARERARRLAGKDGLLATLDAGQLHALVAPSMSPAWPTDHVNGDHFTGAGYGIAAVAGTPSITVPSGQVRGLPIGIVFMGPAYSEPLLIGIAYAFEQATKARRAPEFLPTLAP